MTRNRISNIALSSIAGFLLQAMVLAVPAFPQGNIFGEVENSDLSIPGNGQLLFYGYLDDTDEEIRVESSFGAGYDNGNWFDDFQNYLTEAPGNPYDFHFYNASNGEGFVLSGSIPSNSYHQEDVTLASVDWPAPPTGLSGTYVEGPAIELSWDSEPDLTYHVYRREAISQGSFFRVDDPGGSLSDPGVSGGNYVDNTIDGEHSYHYLIIPQASAGTMGPHSDIITVSSESFMCGDLDDNGHINVLDIVFMINYKYKGGPAPDPYESGDVDSSGSINVLDIVYLINFKYKGGPDPNCP